jgi:hypothetical protein
LLARFGRLADAPEDLSDVPLSREDLRRFKEALNVIFSLSDPGADGFVQSGLRELGWRAERFRRSTGALERAAELFLADEDHAVRAFRWWNANALVRSSSRSDGYQLPDYADTICLKPNDEERLRAMLQAEILEHKGGAEIVEFSLTERPSPWGGPGGAGTAIQIDIKCGNEPEQVEIAVDGRARFESFRFVSTLVIVIDTARGSIHAGSSEGRKRLRRGLAATAFQHFWDSTEQLKTLPELPVHTEKFATKPEFGSRPTAIKQIAVSEIWYLKAGHPGMKRAIIAEDQKVCIYTAPELAAADAITIYRVRVTIWFTADRKTNPARRRILTLLSPNTASFPHFTLAEKEMAERVLVDGGYIDAAPPRGSGRSLELLDTLSVPDNSNRIRHVVGESWFDALKATGVFHEDALSDFAFCEQCLQHHPSDGPAPDRPGWELLKCEFGDVSVGPDAFATTTFSRRSFAVWVHKQLATDVPAPHEQDGFLWDLGLFDRSGKGGRLRVLLAFNLSSDSKFVSLTQRASRSRAQPTLVLTFAQGAAGTVLQNNWKILDLGELIDLEAGCASLSAEDAANAFDGKGRTTGDERRKPMNWEEVFAAFEEIDDGELGHYQIANVLVEKFPERWSAKPGTIAEKLRDKYPSRFNDRGDRRGGV